MTVAGIGWMIGGGAEQIDDNNAEQAAETEKEERHVGAFAYGAISETISAESSIYASKGSYTDAFPDLVDVEPELNRFLIDDLVRRSSSSSARMAGA